MIKFLDFTFQNDLFYKKKTTVPLGTCGLALLLGRNYDGGVDNLSNGTGKTRLSQILEGFIFGNTDRGRFKKFVGNKFSGILTFIDTRSNTTWEFSYDSPENLWTIKANGNVKEVSHKPSDCQAFLQKQIGFSRDEWNYFVYIDQNSIKTLLKGKPAERRAYLENFFNIDVFYTDKKEEYDRLIKDMSERIDFINQDRARLEQTLEQRSKLPGDLWLQQQLSFANDASLHIRAKLGEVEQEKQSVSQGIETWKAYKHRFNELSVAGVIPKSAVIKARLDVLYEERSTIKSELTMRSELLSFVNKTLYPLKDIEPDAPPAPPVVEEPDSAILSEKLTEIEQIRQKLSLKAEVEQLTEDLENGVTPEVGIEEAEHALTKISTELAEVDYHIKLLSGSRDGTCPTCGQVFSMIESAGSVEEALATLKSTRSQLLASQKTNKEYVLAHQVIQRKIQVLDTAVKRLNSFPVFGKKLSVAEQELKDLQGISSTWKDWRAENKKYDKWNLDYSTALAKATALGYPDLLEIDRSSELTAVVDEINSLKLSLDSILEYEQLADQVSNLTSQSELEARFQILTTEVDAWVANLERLNVYKGECQSYLSQDLLLEKEINELNDKLVDADDIYREYRILESVASFFAPKGFKIYELKKRCELLIEKANYWSSAFFQEPYVWSLDADLDNIDFYVQPKNKSSVEPYSCGLLSGGETNRASRVLLFSQLQMIPPNKLTNLLILDEIEANLDTAGMTAFTDTVIPKLKETFPERLIVLISHQLGLKTSESIDHLWRAERKNRQTALKIFPYYNRRKPTEGEENG